MPLFVQEQYRAGGIPSKLREWLDRLLKNIQNASHNNLNSKQGGTTGEYYHLTSAEHGIVQNFEPKIAARISLRS